MIIPIRTEKEVQKLPFITIGLIVLNLTIWIFTNRIVGPQERALAEIRYEMFKVEHRYYEAIAQDPSLREKLRVSPDNYFKQVMTEDEYALWNALGENYKELIKNTFFYQWGFRPNPFNPLKIVSAMFIHANFFHVFFNMLFLWVVGCNIEDEWKWKTFLSFYTISGLAAGILHVLMNPGSDTPCIGASGAIAGVMGAFMIRHFKTKIRFAYYFLPFKPFFGTFAIIAGIWLPIWLVEQFIGSRWSSTSGTAYWAHIGGFIFGSAIGISTKAFDSVKITLPAAMHQQKLTAERLMELHKNMMDGHSSVALGYLPQIRQALAENPMDVTARMILAKLYFEKGRLRDAAAMYNIALQVLLKKNALDSIQPVYQEVQEKALGKMLSENTLIRLANAFEKKQNYQEAVKLYNLSINVYPNSPLRPKVLHRAALILKTRLKDETAAEKALSYLKNQYPAFVNPVRKVTA